MLIVRLSSYNYNYVYGVVEPLDTLLLSRNFSGQDLRSQNSQRIASNFKTSGGS